MSMLIHRCTRCEHWIEFHRASQDRPLGACTNANCDCTEPQQSLEPELVPHFTHDSGSPSPRFIGPGEFMNEHSMSKTRMCDCDRCTEVAKEKGWTEPS